MKKNNYKLKYTWSKKDEESFNKVIEGDKFKVVVARLFDKNKDAK
ncbi:hypothetical protein ACERII_02060 [Evansella sp. AB-rgal1]